MFGLFLAFELISLVFVFVNKLSSISFSLLIYFTIRNCSKLFKTIIFNIRIQIFFVGFIFWISLPFDNNLIAISVRLVEFSKIYYRDVLFALLKILKIAIIRNDSIGKLKVCVQIRKENITAILRALKWNGIVKKGFLRCLTLTRLIALQNILRE